MTSNSNLLEILLENSCNHAEEILGEPAINDQILERKISDLQISPLLDKQLTAAALRLARDLCLSGGIKRSLLNRFRAPPPGVAVEAQRRAIQSEVRNKGLPMELAGDYVDILERRFAVSLDDLPEMLWGYASLYDDLWSDPRIGAGTPTRRIMLAMATVLRARSAQLVSARATRTALPKYGQQEA